MLNEPRSRAFKIFIYTCIAIQLWFGFTLLHFAANQAIERIGAGASVASILPKFFARCYLVLIGLSALIMSQTKYARYLTFSNWYVRAAALIVVVCCLINWLTP